MTHALRNTVTSVQILTEAIEAHDTKETAYAAYDLAAYAHDMPELARELRSLQNGALLAIADEFSPDVIVDYKRRVEDFNEELEEVTHAKKEAQALLDRFYNSDEYENALEAVGINGIAAALARFEAKEAQNK